MPLAPIPPAPLAHAIALFPSATGVVAGLVEALRRRRPALAPEPRGFTAVSAPRLLTYGRLGGGGALLHLLVDVAGAPPELQQVVAACHGSAAVRDVVRTHRAAAMVFLLEALGGPRERLAALLEIACALREAGAAAIAFPDGRVAWSADELPPAELEGASGRGGDARLVTWPVVSSAAVGEDPGTGRTWWRTVGLGQIGLPEAAIHVPTAVDRAATEVMGAEALLRALPAHLARIGRALEPGEGVELPPHRFVVAPQPALGALPFAVGRAGIRIFARPVD